MSDYTGRDRRAPAAHTALDRQDRLASSLRSIAIATGAFFCVLMAAALVLGLRSASRAEGYARDSARDSAMARRLADQLVGLAQTNKTLLERGNPCLAGDPPDSPACVRQAQSDKVVSEAIDRINTSLARSIDVHDANVVARLDRLVSSVFRRPAPVVVRVPITVAPTTTTTKPSPAGANPPITTTTTRPAVVTTTTTTCAPRGKSGACK